MLNAVSILISAAIVVVRRCRRLTMLILVGYCILSMSSTQPIVQGYDWPMWRYDAGRRAASPEELPAQMHLLWTRELAPPRPAWPKSQTRLQFDASYEPVVAGKTLFVGSMVSDRMTAYDTDSGAEKWRFYTDGPIRFAPVVYKGKLYFASDDGYLYCVNAENGSLIRKFLAGPTQNKIIGNKRLIGMWPMRGGPVLYEEKIYFAASIWPFMGTFIYAIDAETGQTIWTNSGSGPTYIMQPHDSPAFAGVAPQGYLVATEDKLLVSGGRSVPAAYDRRTGKFLYYHLAKYGKTGSCEVMTSGSHFFNRGTIHRLSDGRGISSAPVSVIADETVIGLRYSTILAYQLKPGAKAAKRLWQTGKPTELMRIHLKAGSRLYGSGDDGLIMAIDVPHEDGQAAASWRAKVDGEVWNMIAADGKLFVVTLAGSIYCFGENQTEPKRYVLKDSPLPTASDKWKSEASKILQITDQKEGYCLLLGLGSAELLTELLSQSKLHIVAIDPNENKVEQIRRILDEAGLYGTRTAVHVGDITTMPLPPYMANLIVSQNLKAAGIRKGSVFIERLFHSLRPYGGTACFVAPKRRRQRLLNLTRNSQLPRCEATDPNGFLMIRRIGALPDSADWTHQYADSTNSIMSKDKLVKAPLGLLWFGGPSNDEILPRHGHGPSPQIVGGRLFIEGRNLLRAVDVYTGRLLWERRFQDLGKFYDNTEHQPGANEIGSNYVSVSDAIYTVHGSKIYKLDPSTSETIKDFSMPDQNAPHWGTILVCDDLLLATASPISVPVSDIEARRRLPEGAGPVIKRRADWQYLAGTHPDDDWIQPDFDTEGWKSSAAGFGYADSDDKTVLRNMKDHYSVVYIRKSFNFADSDNIRELGLIINYDDAFIAYLNGVEILRVGIEKGRGKDASKARDHEAEGYEYFRIDNYANLLLDGTNVIAIEGHNDTTDSSDFTLDPYLVTLPNIRSVVDKHGKHASLNDILGVKINTDYASDSETLMVMDRHTGDVLWKRDAEHSFRHNNVAMAAGKVFCIDSMSAEKRAYLKGQGKQFEKEPTLYALDARTGDVLWETDEDIFATWLGYSVENDILLQAGSQSQDRAVDEASKGMIAYKGSDGEPLWSIKDSYKGPPILYHDWIITQTGGGSGSAAAEAKVFDLHTGHRVMSEHPMTDEKTPWNWVRFKGCNTAIASENLLTFRSASGAFVDMNAGQGTASIGGFKSGCTSNLIIADGVMNAPDYTRTCICSYQNQASLALVHMPEVAYWTIDYYPQPDKPTAVKKVGINLGAPGNRYSEDGTLWLEFPSIGGPSPDIPVRAAKGKPKWLRHHNFLIEGEHDWIAASGASGIEQILIRMFIQPGKDKDEIVAFDKHIGKVPTWSEDKIEGSFEQPQLYTVRLYFAEIEDQPAGRRIFEVSLQDNHVLKDFDIAKAADGPNRCIVKEFRSIPIKDDLKITLTPSADSDAPPLLNGIEILAEDQ